MSLENATTIDELVATNPAGGDPISQGDDHIRMIKQVLKTEFGSGSSLIAGRFGKFDVAAGAVVEDLANIQAFATVGGLAVDDDKGAVFVNTGVVAPGNAGTIVIGSGFVHDVNGVRFRVVGSNVWLETLGLAYTETAADVTGRIADLRESGFSPLISPQYNINFPYFGREAYSDDWVTSLHRGLATHYPENTLLAFTMANKSTPKGNRVFWEVDVQISSDNIPVLFHDQTVDNLTNGTGTVTAMTLAQLQALKFTRTIGTIFEEGCRMETLDDFVKAAAQRGASIEIETKRYAGQLPIADYQLVVDVVKKYKMSQRTSYSSFYVEDLQLIRQLDHQGGLSLASETSTINEADMETLARLAFGTGRTPTVAMSLAQWDADPTQVDIAHRYGIECMAYTADKGRELIDLAAIGIHRLHTNSNLR